MGLLDSAKRFASGLMQNAQNTSLVRRPAEAINAGIQQFAFNRQQGVPIGQGGTGNSVIKAMQGQGIGPGQTQAREPYDYSQAKSTGALLETDKGRITPPPTNQPIQKEEPIQPAGSDQINMDQMYNVNGQMKSGRTIMAETGGTGVYGGGGGGGGNVPSAEEQAKRAQE